jgi:galactose mutarotase-like enzyme
MAIIVKETITEGLASLTVESDEVRMVLLPDLGGKVISLVWKPRGREYLWRQPDRPLRLAGYGDAFEDQDISGWDECFPTIGEADYPEAPWRGVIVPDHGELWALPWRWVSHDQSITMWTHGVRFAYRFERTFAFGNDGRVDVEYAVENLTPYPFKALWSMHPFLAVTATTRVLLPPDVRVRVEVAKGSRLGTFLAEHPWPVTRDRLGERIDLSLVGSRDDSFMAKLFTTPLEHGWAALYDEEDGDFLAFTFDPAAVPFVGLALMRGGWPETGAASYSVILEPCSGWPDRLDLAVTRGVCTEVPALSTRRWRVALHLGSGRARLDHAINFGSASMHPDAPQRGQTGD